MEGLLRMPGLDLATEKSNVTDGLLTRAKATTTKTENETAFTGDYILTMSSKNLLH